MAIVDEETRQIILRKTWCHGQAVLPLYSIVLVSWYFHLDAHPFQLVLAAIVFPIWSWYSYHAVLIIDQNGALPHKKVCMFGGIALLGHFLVLMVAIKEMTQDTIHMILAIASGLFLVETGAFLVVVYGFRNEIREPQNDPLNQNAIEFW